MNNFEENMEKVFDLDRKVQPIPSSVGDIVSHKEVKVNLEDSEKDFASVRDNLKEIVKRGAEAIDGIMLVAAETQSPRAYEVVATLIKSVADVNKDLLGLHKQIKEIKKIEIDGTTTNITNNSLFVGSTSDLQKLLKGKLREIDETKIIDE